MYLLRDQSARKKGRPPSVAHIWDGVDTLCTMYSAGGLPGAGYRVSGTTEGRSMCKMCTLAAGGENLNNRFRAALARDAKGEA